MDTPSHSHDGELDGQPDDLAEEFAALLLEVDNMSPEEFAAALLAEFLDASTVRAQLRSLRRLLERV
jgi:hypothetical protein